MATRKCKWCGNHYKLGFVASNTMGLAGNTGYCSKKCQMADGGGQNSNGNTESSQMSAKEKAELELEKRKLALEEQKLRDEQEAKETHERNLKADKFKAEGKPFIAFMVGMNPIYLIIIIILVAIPFFMKLYEIGAIIAALPILLVIKDVAKISWKIFGIIYTVIIAMSVSFIIYKNIEKKNRREKMQQSLNEKYNQQTPIISKESVVTNTIEKKEISNDKNVDQPKNNLQNVIGTYSGAFGKDILIIKITSIQENIIIGWDSVKGNKRDLKGTITNKKIILREPGDDKWDGVFEITYENNTMTGVWKSNNSKSTKNFILQRN